MKKTTKKPAKTKAVRKAAPRATQPSPASAPVSVAEVETVQVLRTCNPDMTGYGGFKWPESGPVEAPTKWWGAGDPPGSLILGWDPSPSRDCGAGLHGLLEGEGNWDLLDWTLGAKALIVTVAKDLIVKTTGKVRFPRGLNVRVVTSLASAICELVAAPAVIKAFVDGIFAAAGPASGDASQLAASGDASQLAASGDASKLAASGHASKLAASGENSVAVAAGYGSRASAGEGGAIALTWWDGSRPRILVGYVGVDIEAGVTYGVQVDNGAAKFVVLAA